LNNQIRHEDGRPSFVTAVEAANNTRGRQKEIRKESTSDGEQVIAYCLSSPSPCWVLLQDEPQEEKCPSAGAGGASVAAASLDLLGMSAANTQTERRNDSSSFYLRSSVDYPTAAERSEMRNGHI
jgi:hypothetical protein